ncbi:hypothetical protein ACHAQJ_004114 [Trichoderma viride]
MKFGLHLHQHLLAKWADHYVDYNGLRQMIRVASQQKVPATGVLKFLDESRQNLETFRRQKYESVILRETELCARFGLPPAPATIPEIELVEQSELESILFLYDGLLHELNQLQWFDRVNETAITRIFEKIANHLEDDTSDYLRLQSQWLAMQQSLEKPRVCAQKRISNLTADIRRACTLSRQPTRSLYMGAVSAGAPENVYHLVKNDEHIALREFYLSCLPFINMRRREFEPLFYGLFVAAMMMESEQSTGLLLEILCTHDFVMDKDQMFFFLSLCGQRAKNGSKFTPELWLKKLFDGPCAHTSLFLHGKDSHGRLGLHYAVQYGVKDICEILVNCTVNSDSSEIVADALCLRDDDGMTPFHYAILSGNTSLLTLMLKGLFDSNDSKKSKLNLQPLLGELLLLSVRVSKNDVAELFISNQPNINYTSPRGETALYCAAQANNLDLVKLLLTHMQHGLDANIATATGWTPLMVACANGHSDVVSCLLEAGVEPEGSDILGWTAREHAVFRGHLGIATLFTSTPPKNMHGGPAISRELASPQITSGAGERLVVVNLGSTQGGHDRAAFELSHYNSAKNNDLGIVSSLVLEISAPGTETKAKRVQLPVLEDQINQPFIFRIKKDAPLQIAVRLYHRESIDSMTLLSGGTTTLDHGRVFFGENRESMIREVTVFMMDKETMDLAGTVLLSYVVAKPFAGLQQSNTANYQRRLGGPTRLVGHRVWYCILLFTRHNSPNGSIDLQLTRDLEAVIFHDFSLSESGTDIAIHDVTLTQYKHASDLQEPQSITPATIDTRDGILHDPPRRRRAWSTSEESRLRTIQLRDRLRYTVDFQSKGFKPNTRGDFIQGSLTTLEELLVDLPEEIGFNIEMKYPRFHEAVEAGVAPVTIDINTFIDVALDKIQRLAGNRPIILSSFTPEVCILLSVKQKTYPVMFITNAGKVPMTDRELRAASLQMAVQFARRWNLAGVVFACEALLYCPRLVRFVKNAGLVCASYGLLNNDPINARKQADAGVDIIMADRVKLVAEELDKDLAIANSLN